MNVCLCCTLQLEVDEERVQNVRHILAKTKASGINCFKAQNLIGSLPPPSHTPHPHDPIMKNKNQIFFLSRHHYHPHPFEFVGGLTLINILFPRPREEVEEGEYLTKPSLIPLFMDTIQSNSEAASCHHTTAIFLSLLLLLLVQLKCFPNPPWKAPEEYRSKR